MYFIEWVWTNAAVIFLQFNNYIWKTELAKFTVSI